LKTQLFDNEIAQTGKLNYNSSLFREPYAFPINTISSVSFTVAI